LSLGAEKWVDFRETKDLVTDIKNAAGGEGPHATLVSAASVSFVSFV
jgi:alcohol dehydrogenase, propanol-preferring